jgi:hypothetical protein
MSVYFITDMWNPGGDGCEDRKKTDREVEGVEKREFGET